MTICVQDFTWGTSLFFIGSVLFAVSLVQLMISTAVFFHSWQWIFKSFDLKFALYSVYFS